VVFIASMKKLSVGDDDLYFQRINGGIKCMSELLMHARPIESCYHLSRDFPMYCHTGNDSPYWNFDILVLHSLKHAVDVTIQGVVDL